MVKQEILLSLAFTNILSHYMFMSLLILQRPEQLLKRTQLMERWARREVC